jgi:fluoride ion exporter CrcB/FEX
VKTHRTDILEKEKLTTMDGSGGGGIPSMAFRTTSDDGDGDGDAETGSPAIHASLSSEESRRRPDNNNNNILGSYSSSFPEEIRGSLSLVMAEEEGESTGDQHAIPLGGDALRKRPASSTYPTTDRIVPLKQFDEELQPVASIDQAGTFTTGEPEHDDDSEQSNSSRSLASKQKSADKSMDDIYKEDDNDSGGSNSVPALGCACAQKQFQYWIYIGASAVIGGTLRVYLSRLFGEDCELRESSGVQDSLTALFSRICVTAGGRTLQTGGALFRDWPANMLGCFFMGILTSHLHSSPFPWFHKDHPLQGNKFLLAAHGVGLCGCMTTFASWNTQMVIMMVRKKLVDL